MESDSDYHKKPIHRLFKRRYDAQPVEKHARDELVATLNVARCEIQLAADMLWPPQNQAHVAEREDFRLPRFQRLSVPSHAPRKKTALAKARARA